MDRTVSCTRTTLYFDRRAIFVNGMVLYTTARLNALKSQIQSHYSFDRLQLYGPRTHDRPRKATRSPGEARTRYTWTKGPPHDTRTAKGRNQPGTLDSLTPYKPPQAPENVTRSNTHRKPKSPYKGQTDSHTAQLTATPSPDQTPGEVPEKGTANKARTGRQRHEQLT